MGGMGGWEGACGGQGVGQPGAAGPGRAHAPLQPLKRCLFCAPPTPPCPRPAFPSPHRCRVNTVLPGWIDTSGDPSSLSAADHAWHPAGRVGRPEDVAQLCLFLADGERAGFITGGKEGRLVGLLCQRGACCCCYGMGAPPPCGTPPTDG